MFDIGWSEMAIIMLLALIIIGPKDLPRVARTIGQWVRKGRAMAREFQTSLEEMARDTELEDVKKEIEKVGRMDFKKSIENTIDPKGELTKAFDTAVDETEDKPTLTDKASTTANGHANGTTASSSSSKASVSKASASAKTRTKTARATKTPAAKAKTTKTAARAKKPAAKTGVAKTVAAEKPASPAKRSAKPAASGAKPKRSTAKRGADPSPVDEGGGTDQAAVAAKSS